MATLSTPPAIRRQLWDPYTRKFDGPLLRAEILARGFTVHEFATAAGPSRPCLYNAINSHRVSDRTAIAIFKALKRFEPLISATDLARGVDGWQ